MKTKVINYHVFNQPSWVCHGHVIYYNSVPTSHSRVKTMTPVQLAGNMYTSTLFITRGLMAYIAPLYHFVRWTRMFS